MTKQPKKKHKSHNRYKFTHVHPSELTCTTLRIHMLTSQDMCSPPQDTHVHLSELTCSLLRHTCLPLRAHMFTPQTHTFTSQETHVHSSDTYVHPLSTHMFTPQETHVHPLRTHMFTPSKNPLTTPKEAIIEMERICIIGQK